MAASGFEIASDRIYEQVASALAKTGTAAPRQVRIEVHGAHVVLRGTVRSYYHKQLAQESLRSVAGLGQIINELEVRGE